MKFAENEKVDGKSETNGTGSGNVKEVSRCTCIQRCLHSSVLKAALVCLLQGKGTKSSMKLQTKHSLRKSLQESGAASDLLTVT